MPEEMRIENTGDMAFQVDLLMLAFESHMGDWLIATGQSGESDKVDAFYNSLPISSLLNLSDSTWSGTGEDDQRFQLPRTLDRHNNCITDFKQFTNLRKDLYNNSEIYNPDLETGIYATPHPVKTVLDDFFHTNSPPPPTNRDTGPEQTMFDALLDPHQSLASWKNE